MTNPSPDRLYSSIPSTEQESKVIYLSMKNFGKLTLGAVPIGDPGDASINLIKHIVSHKIILVETPDVFYKLCKDLDISTQAKIIDYGSDESHNGLDYYLDILKNGENILVLSDEGTAGLIDPGGILMQHARSNGIDVGVMAGPNAVIPSVILARLGSKFYFYGHGVDKIDRIDSFKKMSTYDVPIVFFVTVKYISDFIFDAIEYFGEDRSIFAACNLTKENEFTVHTTLGEIHNFVVSNQIDGSITLVIDGNSPSQ